MQGITLLKGNGKGSPSGSPLGGREGGHFDFAYHDLPSIEIRLPMRKDG